MDHNDRTAIDELFRKIAEVERRSGPRDREATVYIRSLLTRQPEAPYYMAQTIVVQEQALSAAQQRIDELEQGSQRRPAQGGFLDAIFGGDQRSAGASARRYPARGTSYESGGPWGGRRGMGGGGFLAGAAQTAMGVAGGVVLGNMLADWMSPDAADAGIGEQAAADDPGFGEGGVDAGGDTQVADAGGDFGGDFDMGDF